MSFLSLLYSTLCKQQILLFLHELLPPHSTVDIADTNLYCSRPTGSRLLATAGGHGLATAGVLGVIGPVSAALTILDDHRVTGRAIRLLFTLLMVVIRAQVGELLLVFDQGLNVAGVLFYDYALLLGAWSGSYEDLGRVVAAAGDCAAVRLLVSC